MATMAEIEKAAMTFSTARSALSAECSAFQQDLQAVRAAHSSALKDYVAVAKAAHAGLCELIATSPELFKRPRSVVLHGVKLGYQKGKGKLVIENEVKTIALIEKHFPDQAEVLVSTKKSVAKEAVSQLSVDELRKVAILVTSTGDVVFAKDTAAEVDKLVAAFLKDEGEDAAESEERQAA